VSKDGTKTTADQLLVDSKDGHNNLRLLGQPYATIVDKRNTLQGSVIEVFPDSQQLQIVGAGKMRGVQEDKAASTQPVATTQPKNAERPIDVAWQRGMWFDGKANTVDVSGQVVAITTDSEGAQNTARGERVRMILVDAEPTTKPSAGGAATTQATQTGRVVLEYPFPPASDYAKLVGAVAKCYGLPIPGKSYHDLRAIRLSPDGRSKPGDAGAPELQLDPNSEKYNAYVPHDYRRDGKPFGLIVWIAPEHGAALQPDWRKVLDDHSIIFIEPPKRFSTLFQSFFSP